MGAKKNYNDILKNRNLKVTKHRYAILESLEKSKLPVSAESLYIELKKKGISISLSTYTGVWRHCIKKVLLLKAYCQITTKLCLNIIIMSIGII